MRFGLRLVCLAFGGGALVASAMSAACSSSSLSGTESAGDDGGFAPICPSGDCEAAVGVYQPVGDGTSFTQSIGPTGGTLDFQELALSIPAGALTTDISFTVTASPESSPAGVFNLTPIYTFSPTTTEFALPVSIAVTFEVGGANPVCVVATNANASGYAAVATSVDLTTSTATCAVTRLSRVFIANAATLGSIPGATTTGDGDAAATSDAAGAIADAATSSSDAAGDH